MCRTCVDAVLGDAELDSKVPPPRSVIVLRCAANVCMLSDRLRSVDSLLELLDLIEMSVQSCAATGTSLVRDARIHARAI
jgi:hypothetical protein